MAFRDGRHRGGLHPSGPERREGAAGAGFFAAKRARGAPKGGEKSSALGLRAAPATIGKPPCNRARGSYVDELMNRGLITGIGGHGQDTRESAGEPGTAGWREVGRGLVQERSGARTYPSRRCSRAAVSPW